MRVELIIVQYGIHVHFHNQVDFEQKRLYLGIWKMEFSF